VSAPTTSAARAQRSRRGAVEQRTFSVVRPLVIAALLLAALFPFYYMVLLSFRPLQGVLQDPGALWVSPGEIDGGTYRDVLAPVSDGGQGFLSFIRNSMLVALGTVVAALLVSIPGAYAVSRLEFFGRKRISALFLAVYFFPSILLGRPAVRLLHPHRPARVAGGPAGRVRRPGGGGVDLHAAQLLRHHPGQPRGRGDHRRVLAAAGDAPRQPAAGRRRRSCRTRCSSS
jgi:hypothetical protein